MNSPHSNMSTRLPQLASALMAGGVTLLATGCSDDTEHKARIKDLEQEVQNYQGENQNLLSRTQELEAKNSELKEQAGNFEREATQAKRMAEDAQRALESMRAAKAAEVEQARSEAPEKKLAAVKSELSQQLAAVVSIDGDVSKGRGLIVKADGKTWLYASPQTLSGNSKLAITGPSGTTLNKFGEFQVAADSPLCRLEILQEVAPAFELAPDAKVEPLAGFITASPSTEGGPLQALECRSSDVTANDFGLETYLTEQSAGCPVIAADSGKVVGMLAPSTAAASLWPDPLQAGYANPVTPRVQRINRTIEWRKSTLAAFLTERRKLDEFNQITRLLGALALVRYSTTGLELDGTIAGTSVTVSQVLEQNPSLPLVGELKKLHADLTSTKGVRLAGRDITRRLDRVFQDAVSIGKRQTQDIKVATLSPFHRTLAENSLKWRTEADQAMAKAIQNLAQ